MSAASASTDALRLRLANLVVRRRAARGAGYARRSRRLHKVRVARFEAHSARIDHRGPGASAFTVRRRAAVPHARTVLARVVAVRVVRREADCAEVVRPAAVRNAAAVRARLPEGARVEVRVDARAAHVSRVPGEERGRRGRAQRARARVRACVSVSARARAKRRRAARATDDGRGADDVRRRTSSTRRRTPQDGP